MKLNWNQNTQWYLAPIKICKYRSFNERVDISGLLKIPNENVASSRLLIIKMIIGHKIYGKHNLWNLEIILFILLLDTIL